MSTQQAGDPMLRRWRDLPLHDFTGALCTGLSWMFDSTDPREHRQAAALCAQCPVRRDCRQYLDEVTTASSGVASGGGPVGTWAGVLVSKLGQRKRLTPVNMASNRTPERVESGTRRGPDRANGSDPLATVSIRPKGA